MNKEDTDARNQAYAEMMMADIALDRFLATESIDVLAWPPALLKAFVRMCVYVEINKDLFSKMLKAAEQDFDSPGAHGGEGHE